MAIDTNKLREFAAYHESCAEAADAAEDPTLATTNREVAQELDALLDAAVIEQARLTAIRNRLRR
jgi:hypothetical protein